MTPAELQAFHKETETIVRQILRIQTAPETQDLFALEQFRHSRREAFEKADAKFDWYAFQPTYRMIDRAMDELFLRRIDRLKKNTGDVPELYEFFLAPFKGLIDKYGYAPRWDMIARLSPFSHDMAENVFAEYRKQLKLDVDEPIDVTVFRGMHFLSATEAHRERTRSELLSGFDLALEGYDGDKLVNDMVFVQLGHSLIELGDPSAAGVLYRAFIFAGDDERNYEMNVAASHLAQSITAFAYDGPLDSIRQYIDNYSENYTDDEFVLRARYALWYLTGDRNAPPAYLQVGEHKRNLSFVVSALVDLNVKEALPVIEDRLQTLENPVTIECFKEAIDRLQSQATAPAEADRMIWMLGRKTRTELALGEDTDNVFVLRAQKGGDTYYAGVEADDSSPED